METRNLASSIDLAFLRIDRAATIEGLRRAVALVTDRGLRGICVHPVLAGTVKKHNPRLKVSAVVAYPLGVDSLAAKVFTCSELIEQGIDELDIVLDLFALVNNNRRKVEHEADELAALAQEHNVFLKAIIEAPLLDPDQVKWVTEVLCAAGVGCIKTGTGYAREPVSVAQVQMIREVAAGRALIKASGGIRSRMDAEALVAAGADILGVSDAAAILG